MNTTLLELENISKHYAIRSSWLDVVRGRPPESLRAVDAVNVSIGAGEILALVGESGSGKTTTGKLITLQERPSSGSLRFDGTDVSTLRRHAVTAYRRRVQMIFQNPYEALDPRYTILDAVAEPLAIHGIGSARDRHATALEMLERVELRPTERFASRYPSDLSGGQLQRVAIARALVLRPSLVVADEPVSMLDVSVRAGVMNLMLNLSRDFDLASLYITHDLAVARAMSSRIAVMYLGAIVEEGPTESLVARSAHPYTRLLVAAVPEYRAGSKRRSRIRLQGEARTLTKPPAGCRFAPRCPRAEPLCHVTPPPKVRLAPDHWSACHFAHEVAAASSSD
jgi:oligopeptide/dipeptide ABC transporter ATP-binding protein